MYWLTAASFSPFSPWGALVAPAFHSFSEGLNYLRSAPRPAFSDFFSCLSLALCFAYALGSQSSFLLLCLQLGLDRAFCLEQIQSLQPRLVTKQSDPRVVYTRSSQIERLEFVEPAEKTHVN